MGKDDQEEITNEISDEPPQADTVTNEEAAVEEEEDEDEDDNKSSSSASGSDSLESKSETAESEGEEGVTTDEGIVGSDDDVESEKELQKNHNNDIIETEQSEQLVE